MKTMKINLKKEDYVYRLNIRHQELLKPFNFLPSDISKIMKGKINETSTITYISDKDEYETTLRFFQNIEGIFKEEFQITLVTKNEVFQAFYVVDEYDYVYINKHDYLDLVKIFKEIDYEVETNLIDLRIMGVDFLSRLLSAVFYQNEIFRLEMNEEDYKETRENMKINTVSYEEVVAQGLLNGKRIKIYDDKEHLVTIDKLQQGLEILKKDYPETYSNIIKDEYDLNDADMFIQCALFGKIIYG